MTNKPHDSLFKSVFQNPENAAAELRHVLAPDHVSAIDWPTLTLEPGSYIDDKLADQHSDLLFSANARTSGERVLVYVLFEHRSSPEPRMALRLLSYMVRIWERFADANKDAPLPLILPAVLAHAPGGWRVPTRFSSLFSPSLGELDAHVLPDFTYAVDDLQHANDADLRRRTIAHQARLALWLMRDARDSALLLRRLAFWQDELESLARMPGGRRALTPLLRYITLVAPQLQLEQIRAILKERAPTAESITMTIAEQLRAEGMAKGKAEGRAEGKLEGKVESLVLVLESRGIPVEAHVRDRLSAMATHELDVLLVRAASGESLGDLLEK